METYRRRKKLRVPFASLSCSALVRLGGAAGAAPSDMVRCRAVTKGRGVMEHPRGLCFNTRAEGIEAEKQFAIEVLAESRLVTLAVKLFPGRNFFPPRWPWRGRGPWQYPILPGGEGAKMMRQPRGIVLQEPSTTSHFDE